MGGVCDPSEIIFFVFLRVYMQLLKEAECGGENVKILK
jgi:hypothetical protein